MSIRGILFDMDGVLIEAKEWHYVALNRALELFGIPISRLDHLTTFDGLPTRRKLEMLSFERGLPVQLHEFLNEVKQQYTMEIVHTQCKPRFVHEFALSNLKSKGYKIAVCSNSVRKTVETMMDKAGLMRYIDFIVSNEDVSKGKPDPEMYLKAMSHFELKPHECLILEDNENGIRAARASGANLFIVKETSDANIDNIMNNIIRIDAGSEMTQ
jgi:beta-phosphoglucomutase